MGATSVTGVSGPGSVGGLQKGSEHMSLGVAKLIGPKVQACGQVTLSGTTGTVVTPALDNSPFGSPGPNVTSYVVILTSSTATAPYVSTPLQVQAAFTGTDNGDWTFGITAGSGAVVNWMLVKTGLGGTNIAGG